MRDTIRPLVIACAVALMTAACGSKKDADPAPAPQQPTAPTPPQPIKVAPLDAAAPAPVAADAAAPEPPAVDPVPAQEPPAADDGAPKNLKVLPKSWSRDRVEKYMKQQISRGLGVKCKHCHDTADFAKDNKHKKTARTMIRMTNEINREFFAGKSRVSCISCHNGKREPAGSH